MGRKVYVITATVGTPELEQCMDSVQLQDYVEGEIEHIIVCDGKEVDVSSRPVTKLVLPWNTGRDRFICHKIYAAVPHLLHGEDSLVMFLDEDNWIEPNHISSLVKVIERGKVWAFALRNVCGKDGRFICKDACESLGHLGPTWLNPNDYLVDTSCYMVPVKVVRLFSECWQRRAREQPEADRLFYRELSRHFPVFGCSYLYTVNYRLEGREDSVTEEFFRLGNAAKNNLNSLS